MSPVAVLTEEQLEQLVTRAVTKALEGAPKQTKTQPLTQAEAAAALGVSLRTVQRWVRAGEIRSVRIGSTVRVVLPDPDAR